MMASADHEVIGWLRRHAVPIRRVGRKASFAGADSLLKALQGAKVIGFGDTTHGTREFFEIRSRLLKFLIEQLQVRALAIEASVSACVRIDDYVCGEPISLADALTGLKSIAWDVREFAATLRWIRRRNKRHGVQDKVRVFGLDIWNTEPARVELLSFLDRFAPDEADPARDLFERIAVSESSTIMRAHKALDHGVLLHVRRLSAAIAKTRSKVDASELDDALAHIGLLEQWVSANVPNDRDAPDGTDQPVAFDNLARSRYMADNLSGMAERLGGDARIAVWAHLYHLGVGALDGGGSELNMGAKLRGLYGPRYYVFCLEFGRGGYLARELAADDTLGAFRVVEVPEPDPEAFAFSFGKLELPDFALDLRAADAFPPAAAWLQEPRPIHMTGWCYSDPPVLQLERRLAGACDGVLFTRLSSPTTPTRNARRIAAGGAGH